MKSKVHPTYKTKYRVANWPAYNRALVRCGDVTVWLSSEAITAWTPRRSGRRGWRKRHLGVDQSGVIRVHTLTEAMGDDATTALDLLTAVEGPLVRITADAAYDTGRRLPDRDGAGCDGRHPTGQDGDRLWPRAAVARAGSDDHVGEAARTAPLEKDVRVPSSEPGGEHVLPIHVHHRRWPSRPESSWTGE